MSSLLAMALSNACLATFIAAAALGAARWTRSAPLAHCLWLLVFVKLLTPPLFEVQVPFAAGLLGAGSCPAAVPPPRASGLTSLPIDGSPVRAAAAADGEAAEAAGAGGVWVERSADAGSSDPWVGEELPAEDLAQVEWLAPRAAIAPTVPVVTLATTAGMSAGSPFPGIDLILASLWLSGSLAWFMLAASRILRFGRLLRNARAAPAALVEETRLVAKRLGLARTPDVVVIAARISPLVWALGRRSRLVLPEELSASLTREELRTLIAHELAHLRRRDHWLRWVEMLALGLYWWFPVAWWARRELRAVEEECCDAWVLWAFPGEVDDYARTLVRTVDFLSESPVALPEGGSGMGQFSFLKRRLRMILDRRLRRHLSMPCRAALAVLAALVLPWAGGLTAGDAPEDEPAAETGVVQDPATGGGTPAKGGVIVEGEPEAPVTASPAGGGLSAGFDPFGDVEGVAESEADIQRDVESLQRQMEQISKKLEVLQASLALEPQKKPAPPPGRKSGAMRGGNGRGEAGNAERAPDPLIVKLGDEAFSVDVAENVVTLWDAGKNAIRWQTKVNADLSGARVAQDGKRLKIEGPEAMVVLDLATGKIGSVAERLSRLQAVKESEKTLTRDAGREYLDAMRRKGYAPYRPEANAAAGPGIDARGPPVDVVRLAEALLEARGAASLARNKLETQAPAAEAGVLSKSELGAAKIELETAERKMDLFRRLARSALKGTMVESERLRELEQVMDRRLKAGEGNEEAVLTVAVRLAHAETLRALLEDILEE